jgi:hypothetical protein
MSFKALMIIKAIVCLAFGIAFLVAPVKLLSIFGVTLGAGATFPAREYGAALFGNLALTWFAREAAESVARLAIIRALFVYDALGVVVTGIALYTGVLNQLGWVVVAVYLFFTLGFGYYLFVSPDTK